MFTNTLNLRFTEGFLKGRRITEDCKHHVSDIHIHDEVWKQEELGIRSMGEVNDSRQNG
jgi:hypothetical protein